MKTVREVIRRSPVWVNPGHTVETAIVLLRGHDIGALPVLDGPNLAGIVLYAQLLGTELTRNVGDVMLKEVATAAPEMTVREAASVMETSRAGRLPVMEEGRLIGVISPRDLLPEVARSFDPLTELPWSDSLREWAIEQLQAGQEITVLFMDIDRFGDFNKRFGHIVGDDVLKSVARALLAAIDMDTDFLCRYGGDEFVIATLRPASEAADLGRRIRERVAELVTEGAEGSHITLTVGQYGGKRTREREHVHYAATLNNLINLASRDCTANKPIESRTQAGPRERRVQLARLDVKWDGRIANVRVDLQLHPTAEAGGRSTASPLRYPASSSAETDEAGVVRIVGETTATSLRRILPDGYDYVIADIIRSSAASGESLVTAVGLFIAPSGAKPVAGSAVIVDDPYRAAAAAVLASVNRLLGGLL